MRGRDRLEGALGRLRAVWGRMRDEPLAGIAFSLAFHVLIVALILYAGGPRSTYTVKRGEPLFVELPEVKDEAPRGNPAARTPGPPAPPTPPAAKPASPLPAPRVQPTAPKPEEEKPRPSEPPRVASARAAEPPREQLAPAPDRPTPRPPEPPTPDAKNALPAPTPPAQSVPAPAVPAAATAPTPGPQGPPSEPSRGGSSGSQVASIPPGPRDPVFDLRSLGRGGGAGGRGQGRGGIEGESIPLDSPDPKYSDYLDRVRRMIRDKWGFPCAEGVAERYGCVRREGELIIEFGIAKDGHVPFIALKQSTGSANMDSFALNAIKLAQPFPPVPDVISKTGFPILARFRYILVDQTLTNILR